MASYEDLLAAALTQPDTGYAAEPVPGYRDYNGSMIVDPAAIAKMDQPIHPEAHGSYGAYGQSWALSRPHIAPVPWWDDPASGQTAPAPQIPDTHGPADMPLEGPAVIDPVPPDPMYLQRLARELARQQGRDQEDMFTGPRQQVYDL